MLGSLLMVLWICWEFSSLSTFKRHNARFANLNDMLVLAQRERKIWLALIMLPPVGFVSLHCVHNALSFFTGFAVLSLLAWAISFASTTWRAADYQKSADQLTLGPHYNKRTLLDHLNSEIEREEEIVQGKYRYYLYPSALIVVSGLLKRLRVIPIDIVSSMTFEVKHYGRRRGPYRRLVHYEVCLFDERNKLLGCAFCREQSEAAILMNELGKCFGIHEKR